ncbi:integrase, partial [Escherichia coli]
DANREECISPFEVRGKVNNPLKR